MKGRQTRFGCVLPAAFVWLVAAIMPAIGQPDAWQTDTRIGKPAAKRAPTATATPSASDVEVNAALLLGDATRTTLSLDFSRGVPAEVYTLANPYRVVIDLPDAVFRLPEGAGTRPQGLVRMFRYGLFASDKARVVIDTTGPVRIEKADMHALAGGSGNRVRLAVALVPTDAESFGAGTGSRKTGAPRPTPETDKSEPKRTAGARPVIVIDPGHGGVDPGAVSAGNHYEKNVVLAVAQKLKALLAASNRYKVEMTRSTDVFVSLDQRVRISENKGAELFISLHADAIEQKNLAAAIRGASVYTLSERASDEAARLAAEKENASDLLAGIETAELPGSDEVKSILIDLMKRETANYSADFSRVLLGRLGKATALNKDRQRAAAFKVLRQTHAPSVLVELGYMSNPDDEKLLVSPEWQKQVAQSIANSIDFFFAKRTSRAP